MYTILTPKFKFGLFLNPQQSAFSIEDTNPLICFADSYDIKEDGSITFYQTAQVNEEKKFKIPVLAYARGQWEACIFISENGSYPALQEDENNYVSEEEQSPPPEPEEDIQDNTNNNSNSELDELDSMLGESPSNTISPSHVQPDYDDDESFIENIKNAQNNPKIIRQLKNDWIEGHLKKYTKVNDNFDLSSFSNILRSDKKNQYFNIHETDIVWIVSQFILDKQVLARKFIDIPNQKILGLILPDIMRRHWDGKMSVILEILDGREETKNVNAIDLAVWMIQNKFV